MLSSADWVGTISLWIGIIAVTFAGIQFRDAHRQAKLLEAQSTALGFVTQSLTTRYLGRFPDYLPKVTELIDTAHLEVRIVTGNPVPAYFTDPDAFLDYSHAIERKARAHIPVTMVCMAEAHRRRRLSLQFPTSEEAWRKWLPDHQREVEEFARFRFPNVDVSSLDHNKFMDMLAQVQEDVLREDFIYHGVRIIEVDQLIAVQAWIADGRSAVFAVQTVPERAMSHGLYTSDPLFVDALHSMCDLMEASGK